MEKFCGCNSKWEVQPDYDLRICDLQQVNYIRDEVDREYDPSFICEKCDYFPWYDVHHENEMFDLRRMNQC